VKQGKEAPNVSFSCTRRAYTQTPLPGPERCSRKTAKCHRVVSVVLTESVCCGCRTDDFVIQSLSQTNRRYSVGMTEYSAEGNIGTRIAAARRSRGFRTTKELAAKMPGTGITTAVLENIESGRRSNLDISLLLNIAHTLHVPVTALLAPIARPNDPVDLPNLNPELAGMTASQFDAWIAGITTADYQATTADERNDLAELQALRELQTSRRELHRLEVLSKLTEGEPDILRQGTAAQIDAAHARIDNLRAYLLSAGWEI